MRRWWNRLFVVLVFLIAAGAIYAVWPDEPDRYLPSAIPWPSGRGVPGKLGPLRLPCHSTGNSTNPASDCRGMTLGLDLQGGSRIVLQADVAGTNVSAEDLNSGLDAAKQIVERRVNPFGVSESQVQRSGTDKLVVELPGVSQQTAKDITRPAILMFCEALQQGGQSASTGTSTSVAVVPDGSAIYYKPGTCEPDIDANGLIATGTGTGADRQEAKDPTTGQVVRVKPSYVSVGAIPSKENIVWTPAKGTWTACRRS